MANAEGVKDAAEAYRYGYRQREGRDGMTLCRPDRSVQHPRAGPGEAGKGNHFAAWQEPNLFMTEVRAAFRSLR